MVYEYWFRKQNMDLAALGLSSCRIAWNKGSRLQMELFALIPVVQGKLKGMAVKISQQCSLHSHCRPITSSPCDPQSFAALS